MVVLGGNNEYQVSLTKFLKFQPFLCIFRENGWFFKSLQKCICRLSYIIDIVLLGLNNEYQVSFTKLSKFKPMLWAEARKHLGKFKPFSGICRDNGWIFESLKKCILQLSHIIYMVVLDGYNEYQVKLTKFLKFQPFLRIFRENGWFFKSLQKCICRLSYIIDMVILGVNNDYPVSFTKLSKFQQFLGICRDNGWIFGSLKKCILQLSHIIIWGGSFLSSDTILRTPPRGGMAGPPLWMAPYRKYCSRKWDGCTMM